jgi:hypothetical protein
MKKFDDIKKGDKVTWKSFQMDAPGGVCAYTGVAKVFVKAWKPELSDCWMCRVEGYRVLLPMTRTMLEVWE